MKKRLQNILAHAGIASRRASGLLIRSGKVKVDGKTITEKGLKLDPDEHKIWVNGRLIKAEKKYYLLLNKPEGIVSTVKDTHNRKKVTDFFKKIDARLYPVGRLDKDTTGIIIVTNDGSLTNKLSHPRYAVEKVYEAVSDLPLSEDDIEELEKGIMLDGKKTAPCSIDKKSGNTYIVKLHEGRKRQIRRMFSEKGAKVTALKRVRYAGLTLRGLKEGEYRELTAKEVERLKRG